MLTHVDNARAEYSKYSNYCVHFEACGFWTHVEFWTCGFVCALRSPSAPRPKATSPVWLKSIPPGHLQNMQEKEYGHDEGPPGKKIVPMHKALDTCPWQTPKFCSTCSEKQHLSGYPLSLRIAITAHELAAGGYFHQWQSFAKSHGPSSQETAASR